MASQHGTSPPATPSPTSPRSGFRALLIGRLGGRCVVLAEAGQMSPQPPESDRGDDAAGHVRQPELDLAVTLGLRPPEPERHQQDAPRVRQGRQQPQEHPAGPRPPLAEYGRRHQRLAVSRLERVDCPQAHRHQDQPQGRQRGGPVEKPRQLRGAEGRHHPRRRRAPPRGGQGGTCRFGPRRLRHLGLRHGGREVDLDVLGPPLLDIAELPDRPDRDRLDVPRQVIAADHGPVPPTNGEPARPFAAGIVDVLDRQMAGGRQSWPGNGTGSGDDPRRPARSRGNEARAAGDRWPPATRGHSVGRSRGRSVRNQSWRSTPGNAPISIRRSRVRVSSERLTS